MLNRILIDPVAFAAKGDTLSGSIALSDLDERTRSPDIANTSTNIAYTVQAGHDRWQRPYLDLTLSGKIPLYCQSCGGIWDFTLEESARIVLFTDEQLLDKAMEQDETLEGILQEPELDLLSLIEDQILLALPFAPRHESCNTETASTAKLSQSNPFAVLAGLKKSA